METFTYDAFLGGKITLKQSKESYRATSDAIWLASCVPVQKGQSVLDVGIGTGAVSLALLEREASLEITGIDKQPSLLLEAKENAVLNKHPFTLVEGDISAPLPALKGHLFHHVVTNPPFFKQTPARKGKNTALAHQEQLPLADWIGFCLKHVRRSEEHT
ncbi:MAG: methyltransferase, partial [Alphaproteobacteria bacterium]|nr:methyltransferase [Alphaproteobacteria bacterium]